MEASHECLDLRLASRKEQTTVKSDHMVEKKLNQLRVMKANAQQQNRTMMRKKMLSMISTLRVVTHGVHSRKVAISIVIPNNATIMKFVELPGTTLRVVAAVVTTMMSMVSQMAKQRHCPTNS
jgi:hypothetical protein